MNGPFNVGDIVRLRIGACRVMVRHGAGTYDVEHLDNGNWYRITGYR